MTPAPEPAEARLRRAANVEYGECACGCGQAVEDPRQQQTRRFYATPLCAYRGLMKRRGEASAVLRAAAQDAQARAARAAARPPLSPPPRRARTQDELDHAALRYGPIRAVREVLETDGRRARVRLECGHERRARAGAPTARCAKCRRPEDRLTPGRRRP